MKKNICQIVHSFYSWQFKLSYILATKPKSCAMLKGSWKSTGGYFACWHEDEFNKTTHLFSHLHLRKGPVIVADVEQADSLWKQPTKDKKIMVNTSDTLSLGKYLSGNERNHCTASIFQLVTEWRRCEITPLRALLPPCAARCF